MESCVSPVTLYGENYDDFMRFFQMKPDVLVKEHDIAFCDLMYEHIDASIYKHTVQDNPVVIMPPFGEDVVWLNTSRPLDFHFDLGNKVYVIDFFTYCCINCIHILPYIKKVESEYKSDSGFAVIGVHSPKFLNEKNSERVKDALILNDINHPVINDFNCSFWKKYGVTCWPTVFIVGPQNILLFILVGETQIDKLPFMCQSIMQYYKLRGEELDESEVPVMPLSQPAEKVLHFPSNVSTNNELIVVSDTGHNCLLLMSSKLEFQTKIGSSAIGCEDGPFYKASFNAPHGTVWYNSAVFVADTGNHSIRKVDILTQEVTTVFKMMHKVSDVEESENCTFVEDTGVVTHSYVFKSPWDICVGPELGSDLKKLNVLYIAVAGSHQIWCLHMEADNLCEPFAGSGNEENRQNCYRLRAGFAQPSGITYSEVIPEFLFVADSESSTIKSISLIDGSVKIVVGGTLDPLDLFGFGDVDGKGRDVKLQHPMSVCVINSEILAVADTYNHKIKLIKLDDRSCTALDKLDLCEPSGICTLDDKLIIADTNNHRIKIFTLEGVASRILPEPFKTVVSFNISPKCPPITKIKLGYGGKIQCFFKMEENHPVYSLASFETPWEVSFEGEPKCSLRCDLPQLFHSKNITSGLSPITIKANHYSLASVHSENSQCILTFTVNAQLCNGIMKVCSIRDITFKVAVEFSKLGSKHVKLIFTAAIFDVD